MTYAGHELNSVDCVRAHGACGGDAFHIRADCGNRFVGILNGKIIIFGN